MTAPATPSASIKSAISSNPYFKVSNLSDISDCDYALSALKEIEESFGDHIILNQKRSIILVKKEKLQKL